MAKSSEIPRSVYDAVPLPLGKTMCIRVIKLRPSLKPDYSDDIVCDFSILDVDGGTLLKDSKALSQYSLRDGWNNPSPEHIQYQALSYTWGNSGADWNIVLNGTLFSVRKNLWDFLAMARRSKVEGYLWIDALCIDQTTTKEKSHQVSMMGEIYSRAESVIVWLESHTSAEEHDVQEALDTPDDYVSTDPLPPKWHDVMDCFCRLSYWRRAWIVQEYFLAKRKELWYGRLRIDSTRIKDMIECYESRTTTGYTMMFYESASMIGKEMKYDSPARFGAFANLVDLFRHLDCSDPRDRIYALLPLLSPDERRDIGLSPDYSVSATSIFLQLVSRLRNELDHSQNLRPDPIFGQLEYMLKPDLQSQAVQLAVLHLALKGKHTLFGKPNICDGGSCWHHVCGGVIGVTGCSMCRKKPFLSIAGGSISMKEYESFSGGDWKLYVRALLASENVGDRDLGIKYCGVLKFGTGGNFPDLKPVVTRAKLRNLIAIRWTSFQTYLCCGHEVENSLVAASKPY